MSALSHARVYADRPGAPGRPVPAGMYVDDAEILLPVGVVLASRGRRIAAFFIAYGLFVVTLGVGYVIWGLAVWARGTTPALQVLGMRCWMAEDAEPATWRAMLFRETIGRFGDSITFGIGSFLMFAMRRDRRSMHDYLAMSVVVHDPNGVLHGWRSSHDLD